MRFEQTKQAFLHVRSYGTAWDFMAAAVDANGVPEDKDQLQIFYGKLLSWVIDKLIEAEHVRPASE